MPQPPADNMIVTIDGPAGSGKSTVARMLARRLDVDFLDTGAMYRGVAAEALDHGIDTDDADAVAEFAAGLTIRFNWDDDPPSLKIDGRDVTHRLRDADTTRAVSEVAQNAAVRQVLVRAQRWIGGRHPRLVTEVAQNAAVRQVLVRAQRWIGGRHPRLVTEGRDQGSVVFPEAAVKFYVDARPEVRAHRRADQLKQAGKEADEQLILQQIQYRDERDKSRSDGPLICPDDAIEIDTSDMSLEQVVDTLYQHVVQRTGAPGGSSS